jgi:hypothetical protein
VLAGEGGDLVHVDAMVLPAHTIGHDLEPLAGHVDGRAVGQVAAGRQAEPHEGVAGLHEGHEGSLVGRAARVRLDVGEAALEDLLRPLDREGLHLVDVLAAAVVAIAGIALRVFVGQGRADRFEHSAGDHVLRCDQLDLVLLALELATDHAGDLGIALVERSGEEGRELRLLASGCSGGHVKLSSRVRSRPIGVGRSYHAVRTCNKGGHGRGGGQPLKKKVHLAAVTSRKMHKCQAKLSRSPDQGLRRGDVRS